MAVQIMSNQGLAASEAAAPDKHPQPILQDTAPALPPITADAPSPALPPTPQNSLPILVPSVPPEYQDLYQKLTHWRIDRTDDSMPKSYLRKLAKELLRLAHEDPGVRRFLPADPAKHQAWSLYMADRVRGQYKRFLFLAKILGQATPSPMVDEAWHLHLLYTANYRELCNTVIGYFVDHDPGNGEEGDRAKFTGILDRTLDTYCKFWGEPPVDIWGPRVTS